MISPKIYWLALALIHAGLLVATVRHLFSPKRRSLPSAVLNDQRSRHEQLAAIVQHWVKKIEDTPYAELVTARSSTSIQRIVSFNNRAIVVHTTRQTLPDGSLKFLIEAREPWRFLPAKKVSAICVIHPPRIMRDDI